MPDLGAIVWSAIAGVIVGMLGLIGYLLKSGFQSLKTELQKLWEKLDRQQTVAELNALAIERINTRCEERHRP